MTIGVAPVCPINPSRTALWANFLSAKRALTPEIREHALQVIGWIYVYNPDPWVKFTARGMLRYLVKGE